MRIRQLIQSAAWTDAALALIDLELPMIGKCAAWLMTKANGIARCRASANCRNGSTSRSKHDTPTWRWAILSAFVEAQSVSAPLARPSVPGVSPERSSFYQPLCTDNFA